MKYLFLVTALIEVATGLGLLALPSTVFVLLLGEDTAAREALLVGRIAGGALVALGVASWLARCDEPGASQRGLLIGLLIYNLVATALLGFVGCTWGTVGIVLWPAVVLHASLAIWCICCLGPKDRA